MRCAVDERFPVPRTRAAAIDLAMITLLRRRRAVRPFAHSVTAAVLFLTLVGGGAWLAPGSRVARLLPLALVVSALSALALTLLTLSTMAWRARAARLLAAEIQAHQPDVAAPPDGDPAEPSAVEAVALT